MAFKIKKKPVKPTKLEKLTRCFQFTLPIQVIAFKKTLDALPDEAEIASAHYVEGDYEYSSCYNSDRIDVTWNTPETDEEFAKRLGAYELAVAEYNLWFEKNKERIEVETKKKLLKKVEKENLEKIRNEQRIAQLTRELEKLKNK